VIYFHTKFNTSSSNSRLGIAKKRKLKKLFALPSCSHFTSYKKRKKNLNKVAHFSNIYYHTSFLDPTLSDVNVASMSQVLALSMLLLLIAIN
jgi:hypothetical protein